MQRAVAEFRVLGITTNLGLFGQLMRSPEWLAGDLDTNLLERFMEHFRPETPDEGALLASMLAAVADRVAKAARACATPCCAGVSVACQRPARAAPMKLRVWVDGRGKTLDTRPNGALTDYEFEGAASGAASIEEVRPGFFSVLLGNSSFTVNLAARGDAFEAVSKDGHTHLLSVSDTRDRVVLMRLRARKGPH